MAQVPNWDFEAGNFAPTSWSVATGNAGTGLPLADIFANYYAGGGATAPGVESFKWGWLTETWYETLYEAGVAVAKWDLGARLYDSFGETWYDAWADVFAVAAKYGWRRYEDWELAWYAAWDYVATEAAMYDAGANAYENFEVAGWIATWPGGTAATYDAGLHAYESFETW